MAKMGLDHVVAHWSKLVEGLATTSLGFYDLVEVTLAHRKIPGLSIGRITWDEGGVLAPRREYLRIRGDRHVIDVCAAPFGTGFFFSSWTTARRVPSASLYLLGFVLIAWGIWLLLRTGTQGLAMSASGIGMQFLTMVFRSPFILGPLAALIVLWLIGLSARSGNPDPEIVVLTVPVLGWLYERLFAPATYYRLDAMQMFHSAVHASVLEALDRLLKQKGLRALTAEERKPVFREMLLASPAPGPGLSRERLESDTPTEAELAGAAT